MDRRIGEVLAWEALDSRGDPTVGCEVTLGDGSVGAALVPSGASVSGHEATALRDGGHRFAGRGTLQAVGHVRGPIRTALLGEDPTDQVAIDGLLRDLDGTPDLSTLGANAILAASLACALAAADHHRMPLYRYLLGDEPPALPMPMVNIVSGGAHASRRLDIQDILVVPLGASSFAEAIEWAWRVRRCAARRLSDIDASTAGLVADEGGLAGRFRTNRQAVELVAGAIEDAGLRPGEDAGIAIDVAASQLLAGDAYRLAIDARTLDAGGLVEEWASWSRALPIMSWEDPVAEDDELGWRLATAALGHLQVVGDDLFATHGNRLAVGVASGIANAILIKPNQVGTLSDALTVLRQAQAAGYRTVISARSGETEDVWLSDLAVGWSAGQVKVGSTTRSERTAKWNRLLMIEARHAGSASFAREDPRLGTRPSASRWPGVRITSRDGWRAR